MSTLHGSWIVKPETSYLFLWLETWKTTSAQQAAIKSVVPHPFQLERSHLKDFLQSHALWSNNLAENWLTETFFLPSEIVNQKKAKLPILSEQLVGKIDSIREVVLHPWQIDGIGLNASEAVIFLEKLPLGFAEDREQFIGEDLKFWLHLYRWSLELLVRGKFLPGIVHPENEIYYSQWFPLLDSTLDRARFAKFTQLIPPVCLAYQRDNTNEKEVHLNWLEGQTLILDFLQLVIDAKIRQLSPLPSLPLQELFVKDWLRSLTQPYHPIEAKETDIKRLENAWNNWTLSIQEHLASPTNQQLKTYQFRVCLILQPPSSKAIENGQGNWLLKYGLQSLDNTHFLIAADTIWQQPVEQLIWQQRTIERPQETLLKGLGLASRLYTPIADSLQLEQPSFCELDPIQVYEFIRSTAWTLQDSGLGVILPPSLATGAAEKRLGISIQAKVAEKKGERLSLKSLLNYDLKLAIGEQTISKQEFEKLLAQRSPVVKINEEWIALQPADVRAAQAIFNNTYEAIPLSVEDALRLTSGDTQTLAKLPVVNFETTGVLEELINNLTNNQSIQPIEHPEGFKGTLRPYQARGVGWLAFLEKWGLGACLADDMGLGKTAQLLGLLLHLKAEDMLIKPTLILCPTSVVNNWEREVRKFSPMLSTFIHHGDKRSQGKGFAKAIKDKNIVITSYSLVYRDLKTLEQIDWQGVVLDEAQNIKNPQAKQSQAVRKLPSGFRIALTGTPVENRLSELWSILDFLNPGFLGTQIFFKRRFATPIEKYGDRESLNIMRSLVRPFILRRLKTDRDIIQDLPEKQEMDVFCGLSEEQAKLYQLLVDRSLEKIEESTGIQRRGLILTLLLQLKQLCNHPAQFLKEKTLNSSQRSGKLLRLEEMLEELVSEGDHALIFTQFAEWGKLLQPYLQSKFKQDVLFLYGATPREKRQEMIDRFQNDPQGPSIFILSLKAGGTGLNLTRANHVFHVDRWWNPAVENQATDRAFRIGQKQNVQVHKFICTGTLEERINEMLESKKQLAEQTVDAGEKWLTELDTDHLRTLLFLDRDAIIDEGND